MGENNTKKVYIPDISPTSRKACPRAVETTEGGTGATLGEGSGGGRTPGRGPADRVQGGDEGGRSQGGDRRDLEHVVPDGTQATAVMATHGGVDGGRSHR